MPPQYRTFAHGWTSPHLYYVAYVAEDEVRALALVRVHIWLCVCVCLTSKALYTADSSNVYSWSVLNARSPPVHPTYAPAQTNRTWVSLSHFVRHARIFLLLLVRNVGEPCVRLCVRVAMTFAFFFLVARVPSSNWRIRLAESACAHTFTSHWYTHPLLAVSSIN